MKKECLYGAKIVCGGSWYLEYNEKQRKRNIKREVYYE